jgi:hypothetical protein
MAGPITNPAPSQPSAPQDLQGSGQPQTASASRLLTLPRRSDERFWSWFNDYVKAVIAIAILGSQITFTLVVSDIADPASIGNASSLFHKETVRLLISISWLLFICTLGVGVITSLLFAADPRDPSDFYFAHLLTKSITFLLNFLPVGAFLLLSLATTAYVPIVGWIGVALLSLFAGSVFYLWLSGRPRRWLLQRPSVPTRIAVPPIVVEQAT